MCDYCWDADERKLKLGTDDCDGNIIPFMTLDELKSKIAEKWVLQKKTTHFVYKDAVINPPKADLTWTEVLNNTQVKLTVTWL